MKKALKLVLFSSMTATLLIACSNNENASSNSDESEDLTEEANEQQGSAEGLPERRDFGADDEEDETSTNLGEGTTEDQLDLIIGDTGKVESILHTIELTLNGVRFEESIGDETPERDFFIVADITLKNLEDETIDIEDALDKFELTGFLEGSGGGEYSHYYDAIEQMQGELGSGEEIDGQLLFEENESEEYHIRVTEGLLSANGVKNQVIWTFTEDDAN